MKFRAIIIFLFLVFAFNHVVLGQEKIVMGDDTTGVVVHADPRLELVVEALKSKAAGVSKGVIRSGRGFRIQIYNGNDRRKATEVKVDFLRRYPGVRTYMTYIQPQYRVKVGDFRTRADASQLYQELNSIYPSVMIVPDIIVINTFKDDP